MITETNLGFWYL